VTSLYRHFDSESRLLYVGISDNVKKRLAQHERASWWWPRVNRITIEHFGTRAEAAAAEVVAIEMEKPAHNQRRRLNKRSHPVGTLRQQLRAKAVTP
jgi:excinuclease UvrABC nuclease subunit